MSNTPVFFIVIDVIRNGTIDFFESSKILVFLQIGEFV
jgi:hypothetical protein